VYYDDIDKSGALGERVTGYPAFHTHSTNTYPVNATQPSAVRSYQRLHALAPLAVTIVGKTTKKEKKIPDECKI